MNGTCKGRLDGTVNERKANDTIRYLQGLFDVPKFVQEHPKKLDGSPMDEVEVPYRNEFANLKAVIDRVGQKSKYNKVDLNQLFSFMHQ